ncbi:MAG: zf-HC2 domain-containing protein [Elusimicrobia bacterium]|nr:zf-HC2 domain-containing protein [Elusimicrobiota bacterium]
MDHSEIEERIFEFFDGELDAAASVEIGRHLDACGPCRQRLERWLRVSRFLRAPAPRAGPDFAAAVMSRLPRESPAAALRGRLSRAIMVPVYAFAAAALFLALVPRPESQPSTDALLLSDEEAEWAAGSNEPSAEELIGLSLEAP